MADIKKLFLSHPESEKISKIFIPDKPSTGNKEIGDIFVVLNCDEDENNKLFVRFLKDKIEEYYINTSEKSIKSNSDKKNVGNIFENFLFSLNRDFQKLKKDNEILINTSKLNLLIGVLYNDKKNERSYVYFSQIGKIESLLIYETSEVNLIPMELIPRTTRAQRMDALSSQASIAGYKAALLSADYLPKYFPML